VRAPARLWRRRSGGGVPLRQDLPIIRRRDDAPGPDSADRLRLDAKPQRLSHYSGIDPWGSSSGFEAARLLIAQDRQKRSLQRRERLFSRALRWRPEKKRGRDPRPRFSYQL